MFTNHEPFPTDLDYVLAEVAWVQSRCKRIDVEGRLREVEEDAKPHPRTVGTREPPLAKEYRRRLPALREAEDTLRTTIDARVALNRMDGPLLAIDEMGDEHALTDLERTILLLACLPTLGRDFSDSLNHVSSLGFAGGSLCVEAVWGFMQMTGTERIKSRAVFMPTAPLLFNGLITMTIYGYGNNAFPSSLPGATVDITSKAFAQLLGLPEMALAVKDDDKNG